jgi:hypothetical protein
MFRNLYTAVIATGAVATIASAVLDPTVTPFALSASGGALAGVSLMNEQRRIAETKIREASKVTTAFQQSYAVNKGVVQAEEISIYGEIELEKAVAFLTALAEENNGQQIDVGRGVTYMFPHPESTIEAINKTAQNWAAAQTQQLQNENQNLKQTISNLQNQQLAAAAAAVTNGNRRSAALERITNAKDSSWNELM